VSIKGKWPWSGSKIMGGLQPTEATLPILVLDDGNQVWRLHGSLPSITDSWSKVVWSGWPLELWLFIERMFFYPIITVCCMLVSVMHGTCQCQHSWCALSSIPVQRTTCSHSYRMEHSHASLNSDATACHWHLDQCTNTHNVRQLLHKISIKNHTLSDDNRLNLL
jgi:hypothetical protein